ncbi:Erg28-like protein [Auriculariales sp. MPI-PUGE-AT-0066]|nr:Erg28-like protein [Auriculariales sp. MPI-PUGE-AT-0066]
MSNWLPGDSDWLPKWQLITASLALFNVAQNFTTTTLTKRVYSNTTQVTDLSARTFGVWTLLSAVLRFYCAYNVRNAVLYDVTIWSYVIAFAHFGSEIFVFKTAKLVGPALSPVIVASTSLIWMLSQRSYYLGL